MKKTNSAGSVCTICKMTYGVGQIFKKVRRVSQIPNFDGGAVKILKMPDTGWQIPKQCLGN